MTARPQRGFVLVMVLAMLVVLSLLAGTVALVAQRLRDQAMERERALQDDIDMASTRATVTYLLTTQPVTFAGLTVDSDAAAVARQSSKDDGDDGSFNVMPMGNEIALDGRAQRGLGDIRFALQDDSGLFGVNLQSEASIDRLLKLMPGIQRDVPSQVLMNRLLDYQDDDDIYRIGSMEREGYLAAGLRPPSNLPLSTPLELLRVPGWDAALSGLSTGEVLSTLSTDFNDTTNINTAPLRNLRTLPGVDADMAARVIARRELQPFLTAREFFEFLGLVEGEQSMVGVYPSPSGTLRMWSARGGQIRVMHWTMTPTEENGRPWREDYELIHSNDRTAGELARPVASRLFPQPVPAQD